jgi:hypothetical protein
MKKIPVLVVLVAVMFLAGCMTMTRSTQNSSIWFDNKSGETVTCYIDDQMVFSVGPGKRQIYSVSQGVHKWEARSGNHFWHGTVELGWGEVRDLALEAPDS